MDKEGSQTFFMFLESIKESYKGLLFEYINQREQGKLSHAQKIRENHNQKTRRDPYRYNGGKERSRSVDLWPEQYERRGQ